MHAVNTPAPVGNRVKQLKTILTSMNLTQWANSLRKATSALNGRNIAPLMDSAPSDVEKSAELQYEVERKHGYDIKLNNGKWMEKQANFAREVLFRIPLPRETWERVGQPKWSGQEYLTDGFKGPMLRTHRGRNFPVKHNSSSSRNESGCGHSNRDRSGWRQASNTERDAS